MLASRLHRLARVLRSVALEATAEAGDSPIAPHELVIVEDVYGHPGTSISDIVARTGIAQSMVSQSIAGLRRLGAVTTDKDPHDGRRTRVTVSEHLTGGEFSRRGARGITDALRRELPDLDDERLARLEAVLAEAADLVLGPSRQPGRPPSTPPA